MTTNSVLVGVGIVMVCVGIHFGVSGMLPLIVFGAGLAMMFLR